MVVVVVVVPSLPTPKFKLNSFTGRYLLPDVLAQRVYGSVPPGGKKVKLYFILSFLVYQKLLPGVFCLFVTNTN